MKLCGIDEAGRGPVIGPMVMAGVLIDEQDEETLKDLGVRDSKLVPAEKRPELAHRIEEHADRIHVRVLLPEEIDRAVLSESFNLNLLEAKTSAEIITELKPDKAILDCPSTNPAAYVETVRKFLPREMRSRDIVAEHKADAKYPVVSAASIIAKVRRDSEIDIIRADLKEEIGSGYPSDPATKKFLKENWKKYSERGIFRKSWSSWQELEEGSKQRNLFDF